MKTFFIATVYLVLFIAFIPCAILLHIANFFITVLDSIETFLFGNDESESNRYYGRFL